MTQSSTHLPRQTDSSAGCDAILRAPTELFAVYGYDATSADDIARRAGMSKSVLFHHFGTKRGLYVAAIRDIVAGLPDYENRWNPDTPSAREQLHAIVRQDFAWISKNPHHARLMLREMMQATHDGTSLVGDIFSNRLTRLAMGFRGAQKQAAIDLDFSPVIPALMMIACAFTLPLARDRVERLPGSDFPNDADHHACLVTRIIIDGLRSDLRDPPQTPNRD